MGYDLINEPWAGREWRTCLTTGCAELLHEGLQPAYEKATAAIRAVDPDGIVWYEPQQFAAAASPQLLRPGQRRPARLSWHNYCPDVFFESQGIPGGDVEKLPGVQRRTRNDHALDQAATMGAADLMSEFGATDNMRAMEIDTASADDHLMGWMHWAYKHWDDPTTADGAQGMFADDADLSTVKSEKLRTLVRTYPQATAGTPVDSPSTPPPARSATPTSRMLTSTSRPRSSSARSDYPSGPDIAVEGGRVVGEAEHNRILVEATGTEPVTVTID